MNLSPHRPRPNRTHRLRLPFRLGIFLTIASAFAALTALACAPNQSTMQQQYDLVSGGFSALFKVDEIRADDLIAGLRTQAPILLVDVRTSAEQSVSRLPGAILADPAENIYARAEVRNFLASHGAAPDARLVVYCAGGYRSGRSIARDAPETLPSSGARVLNLRGGIIAYANAGGPLVDVSGRATRRVHGYNSTWAAYIAPPLEAVLEPPVP
jgi:rhodanese-related sulfurtransferase